VFGEADWCRVEVFMCGVVLKVVVGVVENTGRRLFLKRVLSLTAAADPLLRLSKSTCGEK
jgi:hypothetical protein